MTNTRSNSSEVSGSRRRELNSGSLKYVGVLAVPPRYSVNHILHADWLGWDSPVRTRNPARERPQIHALDRAATRIGTILWWVEVIISALRQTLLDPLSVFRMTDEWLWSIIEMIMNRIEPKYFERNLSIPTFSPINPTWTALELNRSVIVLGHDRAQWRCG
jgi:hypothetical protein